MLKGFLEPLLGGASTPSNGGRSARSSVAILLGLAAVVTGGAISIGGVLWCVVHYPVAFQRFGFLLLGAMASTRLIQTIRELAGKKRLRSSRAAACVQIVAAICLLTILGWGFFHPLQSLF